MRELKLSEVSYVSGGINCIDATVYQSLHDQAKFAGILTGIGGGILLGAVTFAAATVATGPAAAAAAYYVVPGLAAGSMGLAAFPWLAMWGYGKSSVWAPYFGTN